MIYRAFDPAVDSIDQVATLNEWLPAAHEWWAGQLRQRLLVPQNLLLAVDHEPVGLALIFDGGLPMVLLDGLYLRPAYRTLSNASAFLRAVDNEMQRRGVPLYVIHASERLAKAARRYGFAALASEGFSLLGKIPGRKM